MSASPVLITGANGFVGAWMCRAVAERGAEVRALVRRPGTAPHGAGITEVVGDVAELTSLASVLEGTGAVINTVHPLGGDPESQARIAREVTPALVSAAADAGVGRFIHLSTAAVYDRTPGVGDVGEASALVSDNADDYAVTKRDADAAIGDVAQITRVLLRPPAILGPGPTSVWNTLRPEGMRDDPVSRRGVAEATFAWVHVADLAALGADLATGTLTDAEDAGRGPVRGGCVPVNVAADGRATQRDYLEAVTRALAVEAEWDDVPGWTGRILSERARAWGWQARVELSEALSELRDGLQP